MGSNVVVEEENKEVWAAYFTSRVFLPPVVFVHLSANRSVWAQDVVLRLVNPVNGVLLPATPNIIYLYFIQGLLESTVTATQPVSAAPQCL